jgi:geranylgeranyl diphosphate synthase, type II
VKDEIEAAIKETFLETNKLSQAVSYALLSGGKRIRPLIVHYIAEALGNNLPVMDAALAVEFFHTASLIADDLPCMDNDYLRRGKKSVHEVYGETIALLASYALISEAFKKIEENGRKMALDKPKFSFKAFEAVTIALKQASHSSGIKGAVLGQYYDLFGAQEEELSEELLERVMYLKTGTLFEGSFVLGWVFGGGEFSELEFVKNFARHFGFAFQLRDDLKDMLQDDKKESLNFALFVGRDLARKRFHLEIKKCFKLLEDLPLNKIKLHSLLTELALGV